MESSKTGASGTTNTTNTTNTLGTPGTPDTPSTPAAPETFAPREPSAEFRRIAGLSPTLLEAMMVGRDTPSMDGMTGYEYCGYNIAPATALLGIRKFVKAFFEMPDGRVFGCNTPAVQNGLQGPWIARPSEAAPRRYAYFSVTRVNPEARDNTFLHALLLDYGRGGNPWYDPSARLRDYLVRCVPGLEELLLGKAYIALGPLRIPAGYFVLERRRPLPDEDLRYER